MHGATVKIFGRNFKDLSSYSIAGNTVIIKRFLHVLQVCWHA